MGISRKQITEKNQELVELLMDRKFKCLYNSGRPVWRNEEGKEISDMEIFSCSSKEELVNLLDRP